MVNAYRDLSLTLSLKWFVLRLEAVQRGPELDRLIHEEVLKLSGKPPHYSADVLVAERLAGRYSFLFVPLFSSTMNEAVPPQHGYRIVQFTEGPYQIQDVSPGLRSLASADTYPLAVARSVLLLHGLAE